MVLFVLALIASFIFIPDRKGSIIAWIFTLTFVISLAALKYFLSIREELKGFAASSTAFISLWGIAGGIQFPVLVHAINNSTYNINIYNASSGKLTLSVMLGIAVIGMPMVIAYSVYVYRVFKGKIKL